MRLERISVGVFAFFLWAATAALGLLEIFIVTEMMLRIYARFGDNYWVGVLLRDWAALILGIVWIGLAIRGGEYHYKRVGQRDDGGQRFWIGRLDNSPGPTTGGGAGRPAGCAPDLPPTVFASDIGRRFSTCRHRAASPGPLPFGGYR
jgi:hypothetical protein